MTPSLIICLRHGEKPGDAEDKDERAGAGGHGVDDRGRNDRHGLTVRGWQRAGALAGTQLCGQLAGTAGTVTILVPDYPDDPTRHRPYQTMLPLSERLGVAPVPACDVDDVDSLEKRVDDLDGLAVVCWEHDNLAKLVHRLTGHRHPWPDDRFDLLWLVTPGEDPGHDSLEAVDQRLLAGDLGL